MSATNPQTGVTVDPRLHAAWLLWCFNQGYTNAEDRALLTNWLLDPPSALHRDEEKLRPHLLAMADELLAAIAQSGRS